MDTRTRIVTVAAALLADGGRDAVTEHGFATYLAEKQDRAPGADPVEALRTGWDRHVEFGLLNPGVHSLMYGDPRPGVRSAAAAAGFAILGEHIHRVAIAGRLRVSE